MNQNDAAVFVAYQLNHVGGLTDISVVRSLEYTGRETPPTVILADCYGTRLSVTVQILGSSP